MNLLTTLWVAAMGLLVACGEDNGEGNSDTLFTGLSGLIILIIVIWLVVRALNKRG